MSEGYHTTLDFLLRHDAPAALHASLAALAERQLPEQSALDHLPFIVAFAFRAQAEEQAMGFATRYTRERACSGQPGGSDDVFRVHYEQEFHDDSYWSGGMFVLYWLAQFAAQDGYLGITKTRISELPSVLFKDGDTLIETSLAANPSDQTGYRLPDTALDADTPMRLLGFHRASISRMLGRMDEIVIPEDWA